MPTLPAEWAKQAAVLLTWPHQHTDWDSLLPAVEREFVDLAVCIRRYACLVVICHDTYTRERVQALLSPQSDVLHALHLVVIPNNDCWARDYGPLTVFNEQQQPIWLDFQFNGWGDKFNASLDNQITQQLLASGYFPQVRHVPVDAVLEGGSIEVDGNGVLLATEQCLFHPSRNGAWSKSKLEQQLMAWFGVSKVLWLQHGALAGDDTDAHIDTLARFTPHQGLVYVSCDDEQDPHYLPLRRMAQQLASFTNREGQPYRCYALPWPHAHFSADGQRLPASYANFLVLNQAVLVPQYQDAADQDALRVLARAYPGFDIVPVPCRTLIEQYGSLHCVTMQLPEGVMSSSC